MKIIIQTSYQLFSNVNHKLVGLLRLSQLFDSTEGQLKECLWNMKLTYWEDDLTNR